jgi:hypothetical protein
MSGTQPSIVTPSFEISDHTAAIKARRLMNELWDYSSEEHFNQWKTNMGLGVASNSKRWKAALRLPITSNEVFGSWEDKSGKSMDKPDFKRTKQVILYLLASGAVKQAEDEEGDPDKGLFLASLIYERSHVLNPKPRQGIGLIGQVCYMLRITFHVLQRLIQRGVGLSADGQISHQELLMHLFVVWCMALERYDEQEYFPATFKVEHFGATFVVKAEKDSKTMVLATMYATNA